MPDGTNPFPENQPNSGGPGKLGSPNPPAGPPSPPPDPNHRTHQLTGFPVVLVILLHYLTCGMFTLFWLNLMHDKFPKVRSDDPSAAKAIGFCFIPFFNLYWIFFTCRRLCLRLDEQRALYGLSASNLRPMATINCVLLVIPYVNALIGYTVATPIFIGQLQASVNELVKTTATTAPHGNLPAMPRPPGIPVLAVALIVCVCLFCPLLFSAGLLLPVLAQAKAKAERINCVNNLKQIGLAFRLWEDSHNGQPPFNVSTNSGGSAEFCLVGPDGLDQNSWRHLWAMSNELSNPRTLVCPSDPAAQWAPNFITFEAINVSYLVRSGTNISEINPQAVLVICPIHHNALFSDGSVHQVSEFEMHGLLSQPAP